VNEDQTKRWTLTLIQHGTLLQLIWESESWNTEYWVPLMAVLEASQRIRRILDQLNTFAHANHVLRDPWEGDEFAAIIANLRARGEDLYLALLDTEECEKRQLVESKLIQNSDVSLSVKVIKGLALPLGFVCPSHCAAQQGIGRQLNVFKGFWVFDHRLTLNAVGGTCNRSHTEDMKVLFAVDNDEFIRLIDVFRLRSEWDPLLALDVGKADGWNQVVDKWRGITEENDYDSLFMVLGHNDENGLHLGPSQSMSAAKFKQRFSRKLSDVGSTLLFMNGCSTVGDGPTSFLKVVGRPGFCGLIGAETEIANDFALAYAGRFLNRLLLGQKPVTVGEAFHAMRDENDLFPRNLLYSCYAFQNFRITGKLPFRNAA
jgi:hypothetical protein